MIEYIRLRRKDTEMLEVGLKGHQEMTVTDQFTAKTMGSGVMDVFATPAMLALMEKTAFMSVADHLNEGCGTVGTRVEIEHVAADDHGLAREIGEIDCTEDALGLEDKIVFEEQHLVIVPVF